MRAVVRLRVVDAWVILNPINTCSLVLLHESSGAQGSTSSVIEEDPLLGGSGVFFGILSDRPLL